MRAITQVLIISTLLMTYTMSSQASEFNYNYGQVSYDDVEFDSGFLNADADGFSIAGSSEITPDIFFTASYSIWEVGSVIDVDTWMIGAGYHMPLNAKSDLVLEASIGNLEASAVTSVDFDIWTVSAGVRYSIDSKLEIAGKVGIRDSENNPDTDTFFQANAVYEFQKNIAGVVSYETGDNIDVLSVAARFYF